MILLHTFSYSFFTETSDDEELGSRSSNHSLELIRIQDNPEVNLSDPLMDNELLSENDETGNSDSSIFELHDSGKLLTLVQQN
jgi:hypothetical protein